MRQSRSSTSVLKGNEPRLGMGRNVLAGQSRVTTGSRSAGFRPASLAGAPLPANDFTCAAFVPRRGGDADRTKANTRANCELALAATALPPASAAALLHYVQVWQRIPRLVLILANAEMLSSRRARDAGSVTRSSALPITVFRRATAVWPLRAAAAPDRAAPPYLRKPERPPTAAVSRQRE